uniref:Tabinhibitin 1 n=1 Tax=Tabanus yao TaxID=485572 RepID=INH1_TABYA|nr:RecName: Full=Tabinhibitin 1; AltName: Full=Macquaritin 1; Flags: Precursor [Tabanus yao]ABX80070.1 macquaritin 1 [Tabanus yao]
MTSILVSRFLIAALVLQYATSDAVNYCRLPCRGCDYHVGCGEPAYAQECGQSPRTRELLKEHRNEILSKINDVRDHVAKGSWGLPMAARMKVVVWDAELAGLAKRHTKGCVGETHACRNTERFWLPGQLNFKYSGDKLPRIRELIDDAVKKGHLQKHNITREFIENYRENGPNGNVKGLALAISDRVTAVGCGLTTWEDGAKARALLTCNFSSQNIRGRPVYKIGNSPGEKCIEKDETYKNLCSATEPIDPNKSN